VRTFLNAIDTVNGYMGQITKWLVIIAAGFTCLEVTQRYLFASPTMWGYEAPIHIGAAMYVLAWGYVHREKGHVRVDVFYGRFPDIVKARIDVVAFLVLFLPVIGFLTYQSFNWMVRAWTISEKSVFTYLYWPIAPLRTAIFVGLLLLLLQGIAQFWRDLYLATRGERYD